MDITSVQYYSRHNISLHQIQYLPDTVSNGSSSAMIQQGDLTSVTNKTSKAITCANIKAQYQPN